MMTPLCFDERDFFAPELLNFMAEDPYRLLVERDIFCYFYFIKIDDVGWVIDESF